MVIYVPLMSRRIHVCFIKCIQMDWCPTTEIIGTSRIGHDVQPEPEKNRQGGGGACNSNWEKWLRLPTIQGSKEED